MNVKSSINTIEKFFAFEKWSIVYLIIFFIITSLFNIKYINHSYDIDEFFSITSAKSIDSINYNSLVGSDLGNPGVFYYLLSIFVPISTNEFFLRLIPLFFFFVATIFFHQILLKMEYSKQSALMISLLFLGMGPYQYLTFYLRSYTLLLMLILATVLLFNKVINKQKNIYRFLLIVTIFIGFHTHFLYWLFLAAWLLTFFYTYRQDKYRKKIITLVKTLLISSISILPIIFLILKRELIGNVFYEYEQASYIWPQYSGWWSALIKSDLISLVPQLIGFLFWVLFFYIAIKYGQNQKNKFKSSWTTFTVFFWSLYLFTPIHTYFSHLKYFAFMIPFIILTLIISVEQTLLGKIIANKKVFRLSLLALLILWIALPAGNRYKLEMIEDWRSALKNQELYKTDKAIITECIYAPIVNHYSLTNLSLYNISDEEYCDELQPRKKITNRQNIILLNRWILPDIIFSRHNLIHRQNYGIVNVGHFN